MYMLVKAFKENKLGLICEILHCRDCKHNSVLLSWRNELQSKEDKVPFNFYTGNHNKLYHNHIPIKSPYKI